MIVMDVFKKLSYRGSVDILTSVIIREKSLRNCSFAQLRDNCARRGKRCGEVGGRHFTLHFFLASVYNIHHMNGNTYDFTA